MRRELLSVEDWAEIRRLHRAEGLPIKLIARTLGISRNTVRAALGSDDPPKYVRKPAGSAVDGFEDAIRAQLNAVPTMPASVIAERVGWVRGMTVFNERVRELRPASESGLLSARSPQRSNPVEYRADRARADHHTADSHN